MGNKKIIGHTLHDTRYVSEEDVINFSRISGDFNPLHLDEFIASKSIFKKRVAHGMYIASFFSKLLGDPKYGYSGIYLNQTLNFISPVFLNDTVDVIIELIHFDEVKSKLVFQTTCKVKEKIVLDGTAEILINKNNFI